MDQRFIAIMGVLILGGLCLAFAFAFIAGGDTGRTEGIWLVQNTQSGSDAAPTIVTENGTSPQPRVTVDFSNASKKTIAVKTIAHNQSAILISFDGKTEIIDITGNNPETKVLSAEQRKLAEKIALADARVRDIIRASMYNVDIQPLARITRTDSAEIPANGMAASVTITIVNTTTARNETTFFVHVDLVNEKVIRISPLFPYTQTTAVT